MHWFKPLAGEEDLPGGDPADVLAEAGVCFFRLHPQRGHTAEIGVRGELDLASASQFERLLEGLRESHVAWIVVDLAECRFVDSTALSVMAKAHAWARDGGPALVLRSPRPSVLRVLEVSGLNRVLTVHDGHAA